MNQLVLYALLGALALFLVAITAATYRLSLAYSEAARDERRVERMIEKQAERARAQAARRRVQSARMRKAAGGPASVSAARNVQDGRQGGGKRA